MTQEGTPKSVVEVVAGNIKKDGSGGLLSVVFPGWAKDIFHETLHAANRMGMSPSQLTVFSLAMFLEGNGYLVPKPPTPEPKPSLSDGVEDQVRRALNYAVSGADATNKKDKDDALGEVLVSLRSVLGLGAPGGSVEEPAL